MSKKHILEWNGENFHTYLYGSKIEMLPNGIYFENPLMPAGTVINKWQSHTDYQREKMSPNLPLLKKTDPYSLEWEIVCEPEDTLNVGITFFNQANEIIESKVIRNSGEEFNIPQYTYKYSIDLLNAGVNSFTYKYISIIESDKTKQE